MAYLKQLWMHSGELEESYMTVYAKLKPAGEVQLKVPMPTDFLKAIVGLAQTAADHHEAQMRAQILADETTQQPKDTSDDHS